MTDTRNEEIEKEYNQSLIFFKKMKPVMLNDNWLDCLKLLKKIEKKNNQEDKKTFSWLVDKLLNGDKT